MNSPKLQGLEDLNLEIKERLAYFELNYDKLIHDPLLVDLLEKYEHYSWQYVRDILARIIERIETETDLAQKLEGIIPVRAIGDIEAFVQWHGDIFTKAQSAELQKINKEKYGEDIIDSENEIVHGACVAGKVLLYEPFKMLSKLETLSMLLTIGVPADFTLVLHELIHTFHAHGEAATFDERLEKRHEELKEKSAHKNILEFVMEKFPEEIQAYYSIHEITSDTRTPIQRITAGVIGSRLGMEQTFADTHPYFTNQITGGFRQMTELRALGYTQQEIGIATPGSKWDEQIQGYDHWQELIEKEIQRRSMTREELTEEVKADQLANSIRKEKIKLIANEEMDKACRELIAIAQNIATQVECCV